MANKAKYIGSTQIDKNYLEMMFEYRGKTYFVTRPLSWMACSSDYTMGGKTEKQQHQEAQKLIDDTLDAPKEEIKPKKKVSVMKVILEGKGMHITMEQFKAHGNVKIILHKENQRRINKKGIRRTQRWQPTKSTQKQRRHSSTA